MSKPPESTWASSLLQQILELERRLEMLTNNQIAEREERALRRRQWESFRSDAVAAVQHAQEESDRRLGLLRALWVEASHICPVPLKEEVARELEL